MSSATYQNKVRPFQNYDNQNSKVLYNEVTKRQHHNSYLNILNNLDRQIDSYFDDARQTHDSVDRIKIVFDDFSECLESSQSFQMKYNSKNASF